MKMGETEITLLVRNNHKSTFLRRGGGGSGATSTSAGKGCISLVVGSGAPIF